MVHQYSYSKINGYYFCLQQSVIIFAWLLYLRKDEMLSICHGWLKDRQNRTENVFQYFARMIITNPRALMVFMRRRLQSDKVNIIELPVYGQFCMPVHRGYKVINLRNRKISKVFDTNISMRSIESEIKLLKEVSQINCAPLVFDHNIDERWYEEEYIPGSLGDAHKSLDTTKVLHAIEHEVIPCLHEIISFKKEMIVNAREYTGSIAKSLENAGRVGKDFDSNEIKNVRKFINTIVEKVYAHGDCLVHLVFTHGDFCPANFINTDTGIRVLDWESAQYRSMFFDFFSYFFVRKICMDVSIDQLTLEIDKSLPLFLSKLKLEKSDLCKYLAAYRLLYYLEVIIKLLNRVTTDNNLNVVDFISRYVKAFQEYEEKTSSIHVE